MRCGGILGKESKWGNSIKYIILINYEKFFYHKGAQRIFTMAHKGLPNIILSLCSFVCTSCTLW
jgi:hypothetical protein